MSAHYYIAYCMDHASDDAVGDYHGEYFTKVQDRDSWAKQHCDASGHVISLREEWK